MERNVFELITEELASERLDSIILQNTKKQ